jgi:HK97 family phage major capsid protein
MRLTEMKTELKKLQDEVDKIKLDEKGEERGKLEPDEYEKVNSLMDEQDELIKMIKIEDRMEQRQEFLNRPKEEPATQNEQPEQEQDRNKFESFGHYLQAVIRASCSGGDWIGGIQGGQSDHRLMLFDGKEQRAATGMSESIPADGGFLLKTEYSDTILEKVHETGKLLSRCNQIPIDPKVTSLKIPGIDESSRADGSRVGGIRAYWTAEAEEKTASKPKFRNITLEPQKLTALVYLTDELKQDVNAIGPFVQKKVVEEFGFKIDDSIINGLGAGMPLGIMNANALVSVAKENGQAAATIKAENIMKMYSRMHARSLNNAVWYINQDCWPQIFQLHLAIGTGGVPLFIPAGGIPNSPAGTILNRPIVPIEHCQTLGTTGDIIFADLSKYILATKGAMQTAESIHVRFIYDESVLRFVYRLDGQPEWNVALTPFKGNNTQSPYVALATR